MEWQDGVRLSLKNPGRSWLEVASFAVFVPGVVASYTIYRLPTVFGDHEGSLHLLGRSPGFNHGWCTPASTAAFACGAWSRARTSASATGARDGGNWLIAMAFPAPEVLRDVSWGGDQFLAVTLDRTREAGLSVQLLEPLPNLDSSANLPLADLTVSSHI